MELDPRKSRILTCVVESYIRTGEPMDKAGAYGIQEWIGYIGITRLDGSFYNVMGFPTQRFYDELQDFLL